MASPARLPGLYNLDNLINPWQFQLVYKDFAL
jgi:hypothetical protein